MAKHHWTYDYCYTSMILASYNFWLGRSIVNLTHTSPVIYLYFRRNLPKCPFYLNMAEIILISYVIHQREFL